MNKNKKHFYVLLILFVIAIIALVVIFSGKEKDEKNESTNSQSSEQFISDTSEDADAIELDYDLTITNVGRYSGPYMEDASDEEIEDVLAIHVTNNGEKTVQYAEINLSSSEDESQTALFKLSTLEPGATMLVLEAEKKIFSKDVTYNTATVQNVALFDKALDCMEDKLKIQPMDGGFNITNISDEDISGEIMVYFKDCKDGQLYGGITYRGRIEGGMKAGEIRQIMTDNFTKDNTKVMFITITELE